MYILQHCGKQQRFQKCAMQPWDMSFCKVKQRGRERERTTAVYIHEVPASPETRIPCSPDLTDSGSCGSVCVGADTLTQPAQGWIHSFKARQGKCFPKPQCEWAGVFKTYDFLQNLLSNLKLSEKLPSLIESTILKSCCESGKGNELAFF